MPGIPQEIALSVDHLKQVARILVERGESSDTDKPDRRLLLAATEHVAVTYWRNLPEGRSWLTKVLSGCKDLEDTIRSPQWLDAREPLSRKGPPGRSGFSSDPEVPGLSGDPLDFDDLAGDVSPRRANEAPQEAIAAWVRRLRKDAVGAVVAPYFRTGLVDHAADQDPLLAQHHRGLLAKLDLETRALAGHVFRRILMAELFLLRYLADVEKERTERWADYLADRYRKPLGGHLESLCDRVTTYFETLAGAAKNESLLAGYLAGAENRNVVQLVKGDTDDRDRYFLGFNTPYNPEILVATQVGQEGIDLHKECRHVIHHDLCWNPATIEQRTGRVDRIGSKVERERNATGQSAGRGKGKGRGNAPGPMLEIAAPYLAATYDERMFEELYRRAQLFEVTLGGELQIENRIDPELQASSGIGTAEEDLGKQEYTAAVDLPPEMVDSLRIDLSVWPPRTESRF